MQLYERVKLLISRLGSSQTRVADAIGVPQRTFSGYLTKKRQRNLWDLLPKIIDVYPHVSRMWLYFETGPIFIGSGTIDGVVPYHEVQMAVEKMAEDARGADKSLLHIIAGLPAEQSGTERIAELMRKNSELADELTAERRLNRRLTERLMLLGDPAAKQ